MYRSYDFPLKLLWHLDKRKFGLGLGLGLRIVLQKLGVVFLKENWAADPVIHASSRKADGHIWLFEFDLIWFYLFSLIDVVGIAACMGRCVVMGSVNYASRPFTCVKIEAEVYSAELDSIQKS